MAFMFYFFFFSLLPVFLQQRGGFSSRPTTEISSSLSTPITGTTQFSLFVLIIDFPIFLKKLCLPSIEPDVRQAQSRRRIVTKRTGKAFKFLFQFSGYELNDRCFCSIHMTCLGFVLPSKSCIFVSHCRLISPWIFAIIHFVWICLIKKGMGYNIKQLNWVHNAT